MATKAIHKIALTLLVVSMLGFLVGVGTFHGDLAYAWGGGGEPNGHDNEDTDNEHEDNDNEHDCKDHEDDEDEEDEDENDEEDDGDDFCFVIPESPVGSLALVGSSLAALGGFMFVKMRRSGSILSG